MNFTDRIAARKYEGSIQFQNMNCKVALVGDVQQVAGAFWNNLTLVRSQSTLREKKMLSHHKQAISFSILLMEHLNPIVEDHLNGADIVEMDRSRLDFPVA